MAARGRKSVLIVGALPGEDSKPQDDFPELCDAIGRRLAERGHGLIVGSTSPRTADRYVLEGYARGGGSHVGLVRPRAAIADPWTELTATISADVEFIDLAAPQEVWRMRALHRADAVILVGGRTGTKLTSALAQVRGDCVLGVPRFGGAAVDAQSFVHGRLSALGEFDVLERLVGLENSAEIVDFLPELWRLRPRLYPPRIESIEADAEIGRELEQLVGRHETVRATHVLHNRLLGDSKAGRADPASQVQALFGRRPPSKKPIRLAGSRAIVLEPGFASTLRIARARGNPGARVDTWTLFAAALFDPALADDPDFEPHASGLRDACEAYLTEEIDDARERRVWAEIFFQLRERLGQPTADEQIEIDVAAAMTDYDADDIRRRVGPEHDHLDFEPEVNAMAAVIAAREVDPPLSIALLGDWGAGKTHFMRQMRTRVDALARGAREVDALRRSDREDPRAQREPAFWSDIAQIEFNAWHFMDANLWASLVSHIFGGLARHIRERDDLDVDATEAVLAELASLNAEAERLRHEEQAIDQAIADLDAAIDRAEADVREAHRARAAISKPAVLGRVLVEQLRDNESVRELLIQTGVTATFDDARTLAREADALADEARQVRARVSARDSVVAVAGVVVTIAAGALAAWLGRDQGDAFQTIVQATTWIGGVLATAAAYVGSGRRAVAKLNAFFAESRQIAETVRSNQLPQVQALESQVEARQSERDAKRVQRAAKLAERERIERAMHDIRSGRRLVEFVNQRATSPDYRDQLGIISTIREDFERLSTELSRQSAVKRSRWREGAPASDLRAPAQDPGEPVRQIDRIVLYIDDLDRCVPERVVEVMQAVHLLLAFPLFVVVVAVDSRWMAHALKKIYLDFLADEEGGPTATPHNYLEKIFQISFSVRPIEDHGFLGLLRGLGADQSFAPAAASEPAALEVQTSETGELSFRQPHAASLTVGPPRPPEPVHMNPPTLEISQGEWRCMAELGQFFSTPRAVKRFVNTYRIIKVTHADEITEFEAQAIVLFLLAILVGRPREAQATFVALRDGLPRSGTIAQIPSDELPKLLEFPNFGVVDHAPDHAVLRWLPRIARFATTPIRL